ncbi:hypothetical protein RB195_005650 [Necator americanus]
MFETPPTLVGINSRCPHKSSPLLAPLFLIMTEEKAVNIKLYHRLLPRFVISYKDKDELYEELLRGIQKVECSKGKLYWFDCDSNHAVINYADDLIDAAQGDIKLLMEAADQNESKEGSEFEVIQCDEEKMASKPRIPSPYEVNAIPKSQNGSRSEEFTDENLHQPSRACHEHHKHVFYGDLPLAWNFAMDPRFTPWPFFYYIPMSTDNCHSERNCCHCRCHYQRDSFD